jgi:hypothetical protein
MMKKCSKQSNKKSIGVSLLWAAAILSAAILDAPQGLTLILLPILAYLSVTIVNKEQ